MSDQSTTRDRTDVEVIRCIDDGVRRTSEIASTLGLSKPEAVARLRELQAPNRVETSLYGNSQVWRVVRDD